MRGTGGREDREAQAQVLRAVLLAGEAGRTEEQIEARSEGLSATDVDRAVEALIASGLLERIEACLHASGPAARFNRLRPL